MIFRVARIASLAAALFATTTSAFAHSGHIDLHGFWHGFAHPLGGLDHVLAMLAVGLFAAPLGGRAIWMVPGAFVGVMAIGWALGAAHYPLLHKEIGIGLSLVVLGGAAAKRLHLPVLAAGTLAGFFAFFHGHAHGVEMSTDVSASLYAVGFLVATVLLQVAGIAVARLADRGNQARIAQAAGGGIALVGIAILFGVA